MFLSLSANTPLSACITNIFTFLTVEITLFSNMELGIIIEWMTKFWDPLIKHPIPWEKRLRWYWWFNVMSLKRPQTKFNRLFLSDITISISLGKEYSSEEEQLRFLTFSRNVESINRHNDEAEAGNFTYRLGINEFSDLVRNWTKVESCQQIPTIWHAGKYLKIFFSNSSTNSDNIGFGWAILEILIQILPCGNDVNMSEILFKLFAHFLIASMTVCTLYTVLTMFGWY